MNKYGGRSKNVLATMSHGLGAAFSAVLSWFDHSLREGHRPDERQQEMFDTGLSKARPGESKHGRIPSEAGDAYPSPFTMEEVEAMNRTLADLKKGRLPQGTEEDVAAQVFKAAQVLSRFSMMAGAVIQAGKDRGTNIRWGGDWDGDGRGIGSGFMDLPHFEEEDN